MDRDEVEVHKLAKKGTWPISSHLDRTNLVNKGFIIWLLGKFCLRDTAGSPERARWLHLARSGSQSQREIWFVLPARGASHIIIVFIGKLCSVVLLGLSHQLNYLEIWSLGSKIPQRLHSANGRKPSVSETRGLVSSCPLW